MLKYTYLLLVFLTLWFYWTANSYLNELVFYDDWISINELKENIDELDKESLNLNNEFKELSTDYKLKTFLRNDLTITQIRKIRKITSEYNDNKSKIELILYEKIKSFSSTVIERKKLLEEKRKLYSWLIPYINTSNREEYLEYIRLDAKFFNVQKDISSDIIIKKEILSTKVENIEDKIKEHNDYINKNIKNIIETKLDEKINNLKLNKSFGSLSNKSKIKILDKTIKKIIEKNNILKSNNNQTSTWWLNVVKSDFLIKKIEIYDIAIFKLNIFRISLKDKIKKY